jgi:hypothetical protein
MVMRYKGSFAGCDQVAPILTLLAAESTVFSPLNPSLFKPDAVIITTGGGGTILTLR